MRWLVPLLVCLPIASIPIAACAVSGTDDGTGDDGGGPDDDATTATDTGTSVADAAKDHATPPVDAGHPGFDAAPVDASPPVGDGSTASCVATDTCANASDIGSISGDTNSPAKTASGFTSEWMQIKVTEDDSSLFSGRKLNAAVSLVSPAGTNFDLYLYVDTGGSTTERACTTVSAQSTNTTGNDTATLEWGEGAVPNGSDDTRIVSVEVRWVSGACAPGAKWTLTVSGN